MVRLVFFTETDKSSIKQIMFSILLNVEAARNIRVAIYHNCTLVLPSYLYTVNWLLFSMYQFSPFSSVPSMTNLHTDEYENH